MKNRLKIACTGYTRTVGHHAAQADFCLVS
uniref:Uncharacterized protein n=1 Tax=Arundo donax TaxID=35708 RepID=A0A0A8ZRP2_ARUDO